jgi:hypothetical protein
MTGARASRPPPWEYTTRESRFDAGLRAALAIPSGRLSAPGRSTGGIFLQVRVTDSATHGALCQTCFFA